MNRLLFVFLISMLSIVVHAQLVEVNNIKNSRFNGVQSITTGEEGEIEGYCTYYFLEKSGKGERLFEFAIIDKELTQVHKTQLSIHKSAVINNTVFNGKCLLVSVDDKKNKQIQLHVIDKDGEIIVEKSISTEKRKLAKSDVYPDNNGEGFYVVTPIDVKKKEGYSIEKMNNNLETLWKIEETHLKGIKGVADLISANGRFIVWEECYEKGKYRPSLMCYDSENGSKIFQRDGYDGDCTILYNEVKLDKENNIYAGGAYVEGETKSLVKNDGIYLLKLDAEGKELLYSKVGNKEKIQKVLKDTHKSFSLGSKDKVFVEDLLVNGDEIIVVSEMFRKNRNMTPGAIQMTRDLISGKFIGNLGGGSSAAEKLKVVMDVRDFIFFKFDLQGNLEEIKPGFKKDNTKITCWYPYNNLPGLTLAKVLKTKGWFDYAFETKDANNHSILVCKDNASGNKPRLYYYDMNSNYVQKSINLKQQAKIDLEKGKVGYFDAIKNKRGKIALVYYQRKLKKITMTLESL